MAVLVWVPAAAVFDEIEEMTLRSMAQLDQAKGLRAVLTYNPHIKLHSVLFLPKKTTVSETKMFLFTFVKQTLNVTEKDYNFVSCA